MLRGGSVRRATREIYNMGDGVCKGSTSDRESWGLGGGGEQERGTADELFIRSIYAYFVLQYAAIRAGAIAAAHKYFWSAKARASPRIVVFDCDSYLIVALLYVCS